MEFSNPYRPGAWHMPPHLAGREHAYEEFDRLLRQSTIIENLVLTGLRGVGKTVLLETLKPRAIKAGWLWVGTDMSESASVSEASLAQRLITDLSVITSGLTFESEAPPRAGFGTKAIKKNVPITFEVLSGIFNSTPGLISDKLKAVLEFAFQRLNSAGTGRVIFAYDEAQNLSDVDHDHQYPLSLLLDVFSSLQRKNISFFLLLTGLPTLFPKLVDARTYAERMFRVITLPKLSIDESRDAILKPIEAAECPVTFTDEAVDAIIKYSGGYPYFIQFFCRETFDVFIQQEARGEEMSVPLDAIQRKLDTDFFAGRWSRATDRQRQLLWVISSLDHPDEEFTIQELVDKAKGLLDRPFSNSHASQMLVSLAQQGLIYKNRFGKYSFAVPLLGEFIQRTYPGPMPPTA